MVDHREKSLTVGKVIWEGLKRPLFAAGMLFLATLVLIKLHESKTLFDKRQSASLILTSDGDGRAISDDARSVPITKLATEMRKRSDRPEEASGFNIETVLQKSMDESPVRSFKSGGEMFTQLSDGVNRQRNGSAKLLQASLERARNVLLEFDRQESLAKDRLNESLEPDNASLNMARFVRSIEKDRELRAYVLTDLPAKKGVPTKIDDARSKITDYFKDAKRPYVHRETADIEQIGKLETNYQRLNGSLHGVLTDPRILNVVSLPVQNDSNLGFLIDDKRGLSALYKMLWVTLTAIILFALLYLILIPLKHLFFWTTSGDVLTEQLKKLLERKDSVVGPTVTRAVITGIAAVGAGGAALALSPFPPIGSPSPELAVAAEFAAESPARISARRRTEGHDDSQTQPALDGIEAQLIVLSERLFSLETKIPLGGVTTVTVPDESFSEHLGTFLTKLGDKTSRDDATLFGQLYGVSKGQGELGSNFTRFRDSQFGDFRTQTTRDLTRMNSLLKNEAQPLDQATLFGRLSSVSDTLGERPTPASTVMSSLGGLSDRVGTNGTADERTLFGKAERTQRALGSLSDLSISMRRDQLGTSGGNLGTLFRGLTASERFRLSRSAIDELDRDLKGQYPRLIEGLRTLDDTKLYSSDELFAHIRTYVGFNELWENWKPMLRRYFRVAHI